MKARFLIPIAVVAFGCDTNPFVDPVDGDDLAPEPNVTVLAGGQMVTTDTAVLVNGYSHIDFGDGQRGVFIDHQTEYTYGGGWYEEVNDELWGDSWYIDVELTLRTSGGGDTILFRSLDFGDVWLEETLADRYERDTTEIYEGRDFVMVSENYINSRVLVYAHRYNDDGSGVSFAHEPFYEQMVAGGSIQLTVGGSDEIDSTSSDITVQPGFRVDSIWNGEPVGFQQSMPIFTPDQPLVISFNRPLQPDQTIIHLVFWVTPQNEMNGQISNNARAVFMLNESTSRVVIPASALNQIASHLPDGEGGFLLRIYEYHVMEDLFQIYRLDEGHTMPLKGVQSNMVGFLVKIRR